MSLTDAARRKPMWLRIAWGYWVAFGFLHLVTAAFVTASILKHHVSEYRETLKLISSDLLLEYDEGRGDMSKMARDFRETVEQYGRDNVFLLVADGEDNILLEESSRHEATVKMLSEQVAPGVVRRIAVDGGSGRRGGAAVRVMKTALPGGATLYVGFDVTEGERYARQVLCVLLAMLVLVILAGGVLGVVLARRFTAPLRLMVDAARRIGRGDYSFRIRATSESIETDELENAFGKMSGDVEKTLSELRVLTENMAHDLRTPLTRLRAAAELQAMGMDGSAKFPVTVMEETDSMLGMINTMLEIAQTECGGSCVAKEDVELVSFIRGMTDLYSAIAEDRHLSLRAETPGTAVVFRGHRGRLQQMTGNLLDNAVKFTPDGGKVTVRLFADPVAIEVENTGPGIAPEDIPHVFKRFWRADSSRSLQGNGLGLALVKAIAESFGGTVSCTSASGGPTVFRVVLRREQPNIAKWQ